MRRSRAAVCLAFLGALLMGPDLAATGSAPIGLTAPTGLTAPPEPDGISTEQAGTPVQWRLSAERGGSQPQVVEILAGADGVIAFRAGTRREGAIDREGVTEQVAWENPSGDAVALAGTWWTLARPVHPVAPPVPDPARLASLGVDVVDATTGDPDGDGTDEVVVVFRRPFRETVVSGLMPDAAGIDDAGRSLHLGLYGAGLIQDGALTKDAALTQEWVAGTVFRPISAVAACDGALALGFASSVAVTDRVAPTDRVAAGASLWGGFGFTSVPGLPDLPGPGDPACADVDGDGRTEPIIIHRNPGGRTSP